MIRINLIPPEYIDQQAKSDLKIFSAVLGGVIIGVMLIWLVIKKKEAADLQNQIAQAEIDLKKYQAVVDQIQSIEQQKSRLVAKRDVIRNLNGSRLLFPVFYEDFLPLVPSDVWVSDIRLDKQSGMVMDYKVTSKALSNFALATWLTNLQQSSNFSSIKLDRISYDYPGGQEKDVSPTLSFQIGFQYQHKSGPMPLSEFN